MYTIFGLLTRAIKHPRSALDQISYFIIYKLRLTEIARVSGGGERLVVTDWQLSKASRDLSTLAHIQRYEWVLPHLQRKKCLDLGCGSGYGAFYLAKNGAGHVTGVDVSSEAIEFGKKYYRRKNLEFATMDALDIRFADDSFDAVISFDVLEHIGEENQTRFISEIVRVLGKQGALYIGSPNALVVVGKNPFHRKEVTPKQFDKLLHRYFGNVELYGQDLTFDGFRLKQNWYQHAADTTYQDLVIVKGDCELTFGLIAICRDPGKHGEKQVLEKR